MVKEKQIQPLSPGELRTLQLTELELLIEFDRICRKNHIKYTIIGGTLLGAVRHKGFIPWDDDADVALLRSEYEAFVRACDHDLDSGRYYFQDRFQTEGYRWGYGKLRMRGTSFVRPNTEHMPYEQGVYIDVMPVDYIPDSKAGQLICNVISFFFRKASWAEVGKSTEKNFFCKALYCLMALIPLRTLNKAYEKFVRGLNRSPTAYLRCLAVPVITSKGHSGYWRYKADWLERLTEYEFEGYSLLGIADCDLALSRMYGDYMQPVRFPPVSLSSCSLPCPGDIRIASELKETLERDGIEGQASGGDDGTVT